MQKLNNDFHIQNLNNPEINEPRSGAKTKLHNKCKEVQLPVDAKETVIQEEGWINKTKMNSLVFNCVVGSTLY